MAREDGNGSVWKWMTALLGSVCLTWAGAWMTMAQGRVTEERAKEIVQRDAPYLKDREAILLRLSVLERQLDAVIDRQQHALQDIKSLDAADKSIQVQILDIKARMEKHMKEQQDNSVRRQ